MCVHVKGEDLEQRRRCPLEMPSIFFGMRVYVFVCIGVHEGGRVMTNDNKMRKVGGWKAKLAQPGMPDSLCSQGGGHSVLAAGPSAEL